MRPIQISTMLLPVVLALVSGLVTTAVAFAQSTPTSGSSATTLPLPPQALLLGPGNHIILANDKNVEKAPNQRYIQIPLATDVTAISKSGFPTLSQMASLLVNPDSYILATNNCYGLCDQGGRFAVRALRGSLYSVEAENQVKLVRGRILLTAEKSPVGIAAGAAQVTVQRGSSAIVETSSSGLTRVYSLVAYEKDHPAAKVALSGALGAPVGLLPGQELVVAAHNLSEEEMKATDGIERRPAEGGAVTALPEHFQLFEFALAQMANYDVLINCQHEGASATTKVARRLGSIYESVMDQSLLQKAFDSKVAKTVSPQSIASTSSSLGSDSVSLVNRKPGEAKYKTLISENGCLVAAYNDTVAKLEGSNTVTLSGGTLLVRSERPLRVKAGEHEVLTFKGAVVLVQSKEGALKVINMSDLRKKSVQVVSAKQVEHLRPGLEVVFTKGAPALGDIFDIHRLGHRYITSRIQSEGGWWMTTGEVSVKDLLAYHPLIASVRVHGASALEKKTTSQVLKTAAIMDVLRRTANPFQQGEPEDESGSSAKIAARCNSCLR